jgi:hypothetical protein
MTVNIERRALVAFGLLWLGGVRASAATAPDVIGLWSAAVRTHGGLGAQMAFTATEVTATFGALVDFTYEIDGTRLKMASMDAREPKPQEVIAQEFKIDDDKLTLTPEGKVAQVMTRVGLPHPGAHPIVGDWTYLHYTGVPAVQRFSRNGITQLSVPFQTHRGLYRLENDIAHIQFANMPAVALTIRRERDVLTTRDVQGKEIRYTRFEY